MISEDNARAMVWYQAHKEHIERLLKTANDAKTVIDKYEPSGSDLIRPELWKVEHWAWFFSQSHD